MTRDCVLCNANAVETLEHLFFCCDYSKHIWSSLLHWLGEKRPVRGWDEEVIWASKRTNNSRARAGITGFLFATSVYHIWAERNARRFRNQRRDSRQQVKEIVLQLHIYGQKDGKWHQQLEGLNSYPI